MKYLLIVLLLCNFTVVKANELVGNASSIVNEKRVNSGLTPYIIDHELQKLAEEITLIRGNKMHRGHLRNKMFAAKARAEGVGWNSSKDMDGSEFITCYLYSRQYKYCGAAYCVDDSGVTFYTLILR